MVYKLVTKFTNGLPVKHILLRSDSLGSGFATGGTGQGSIELPSASVSRRTDCEVQ